MRRRSRTRRVLKWTGTVLCMLIVATWAGSLFYTVNYVTDSFSAMLAYGRFYLTEYEGTLQDRRYFVAKHKGGAGWSMARVSIGKYGGSTRKVLSALGFAGTFKSKDGPYPFGPALITQLGHVTPLWKALVALVIPTAFLWWLDRRRIPAGHCKKCGYDLTGNVSGICPECGTPIKCKGETP